MIPPQKMSDVTNMRCVRVSFSLICDARKASRIMPAKAPIIDRNPRLIIIITPPTFWFLHHRLRLRSVVCQPTSTQSQGYQSRIRFLSQKTQQAACQISSSSVWLKAPLHHRAPHRNCSTFSLTCWLERIDSGPLHRPSLPPLSDTYLHPFLSHWNTSVVMRGVTKRSQSLSVADAHTWGHATTFE